MVFLGSTISAAGTVPPSRPTNAHITRVTLVAMTANKLPPLGLNGGKLSVEPALKPNNPTNNKGNIFKKVVSS